MPSQLIKPVSRLKLSDSVAAQLEQLIGRGEYPVGTRLPPERQLAEQFGVGRSTMREALGVLQSVGLVRAEHGVGVFVTTTTPTPASKMLVVDDYTVPELFEVRAALESSAAADAARRITPGAAAEMNRILERAGDDRLSDEDFVLLDADLHRSIVSATKNTLLRHVFEELEPLFLTYSRKVIGLSGRRDTAHDGHREVVEAIAARRPREARAAMLRHLSAVERDIVDFLGQGTPGGPPG